MGYNTLNGEKAIKSVRKAVIPAAGLGTRMLPIARAIPKEMLPIVDKPAMAYLVDEAVKSGITDILIITGRNKNAIEDYFDYSPEYEAAFERRGKPEKIDEMRESAAPGGARIYFLRQRETKGLGHAILCAENFVGDEPFAVLYGDDVIVSETEPSTLQLINSYNKFGKTVCGVHRVPREQLKKYCSLKAEPIEGSENEYFVDDMVEKPQREEDMFSDLSILGRVILTPDIFDILRNTAPGAGNEIQLTDAIAAQARRDGVYAIEYEGTRFDIGSKNGFLIANTVMGCRNPETADEYKTFLKEFVKTL